MSIKGCDAVRSFHAPATVKPWRGESASPRIVPRLTGAICQPSAANLLAILDHALLRAGGRPRAHGRTLRSVSHDRRWRGVDYRRRLHDRWRPAHDLRGVRQGWRRRGDRPVEIRPRSGRGRRRRACGCGRRRRPRRTAPLERLPLRTRAGGAEDRMTGLRLAGNLASRRHPWRNGGQSKRAPCGGRRDRWVAPRSSR